MTRAQGMLYLSCPVQQSKQEDTALSRFISDPKIQKLFSHNGPTIGSPTNGCTVLRDLAQILRRECPNVPDIEAARNLLEQPEDVLYPLTREAIGGEEPVWDDYGPRKDGPEQKSKRRKIEATSSSMNAVSVTMSRSAEFSVAKTTLRTANAGFTSARDLGDIRKMQEEAEAMRMLATAKSNDFGKVAYQNANKIAEKATQTKKVKPRAPGQGAITSFFARAETTKSSALQSSQSSLVEPLCADISNFPVQTSHARPSPPPSFPKYKLQNTRMLTKPKRETVLPSSSPTRPETPEKTSNLAGKDKASDEPSSPNKVSSTSLPLTNGFRPASTIFHTTSMAQLQNQAGGQQRKTLGTRRTMQPWSVKHNAPPRPRPK